MAERVKSHQGRRRYPASRWVAIVPAIPLLLFWFDGDRAEGTATGTGTGMQNIAGTWSGGGRDIPLCSHLPPVISDRSGLVLPFPAEGRQGFAAVLTPGFPGCGV